MSKVQIFRLPFGEGTEGAGTDDHPHFLAVDHQPLFLQVGFEPPFGLVVRVADMIPGSRAFPGQFTGFWHFAFLAVRIGLSILWIILVGMEGL